MKLLFSFDDFRLSTCDRQCRIYLDLQYTINCRIVKTWHWIREIHIVRFDGIRPFRKVFFEPWIVVKVVSQALSYLHSVYSISTV